MIQVKGRRFKIATGTTDPTYQTFNVGSGSGDLTVNGTDLGVQPGDTIVVAPGNYNSLVIQNLVGTADKRVTVKAGGLVETSGYFNLENFSYVTVTGHSEIDSLAKNFFVHDVGYRGMEVKNLRVGVTLEKFRYQNIPNYSVVNMTESLVYNGTDATIQMKDLKLLSCEWINAGGVGFGGEFDKENQGTHTYTNAGFIKGLEIAYCIYRDRPSAGSPFYAGNVEAYDIHHNTVYNVNTLAGDSGADAHNGIFWMLGNGHFHHNRLYHHAGQALRAHVFTQGLTRKWVYITNNIVTDSRKYSAFELQSYPWLAQVSGKSSSADCLVANNTTGFLDNASTGFVGVTVDVYGIYGGSAYVINNINYQASNLANSDGVYSVQNGAVTNPIASNNVYNATAAGAGLTDTTGFVPVTGGILDATGLYLNPATYGIGVPTDFNGDTRGNPPAIGAVEADDTVTGVHVLNSPAKVSAQIVDATGKVYRQLFSGVQKDAGPLDLTWDNTDDAGNQVSGDRTNYKVNLIESRMKYTWEGTVGNNSIAKFGEQKFRGWNPCSSMAITGNKAYWAPAYTEGGLDQPCCYFFLDSPRVNRRLPKNLGDSGVTHVCTDGTLVYWANNYLGKSGNTTIIRNFVFATKVSDDSTYTFANGVSATTEGTNTYSSVIDYNTTFSYSVSGMAVQQTGNYLFVAHSGQGVIKVYNKTTGALVQTVTSTTPSRLAMQTDSFLWVLSNTTATKYPVNSDGALGTAALSISGLTRPVAMTVAPDGATIAIPQGDSIQQVRWYSTTTGAQTGSLGQLGGYATSAQVTTDKFMFTCGVTLHPWMYSFMAYAPDGSFWLGDSQNRRMLHFSSAGTYIEQIAYLMRPYTVSVDPANPTRVFQGYLEFAVDYSKPLDNGDNGSWTLVNNWTGGLPATGYTDHYEMRYVNTLSNGRTYGVLLNTNNTTYEIWELVPGGVLRKCNTASTINLSPAYKLTQDGLWRNGTATQTGWYTRPLTGFDGSNNPIFGADARAQYTTEVGAPYVRAKNSGTAPPSPATVTSSGIYVAFDGDAANGGNRWHLGGLKAGTTSWLWQTAYSTHPDYSGTYPPDGYFDIGNQMGEDKGYAGNVAICSGRHIFWGYHGEFWQASQTNIWNHVYDNGLFAGQFGKPRPKGFVAPEGFGGNALYAEVVEVNGVKYLYHGEENDHSGIHRWRIEGTVDEYTIPVTSKVALMPPHDGSINLLANLPFNTLGLTTANGGGWVFSPDVVTEDATNKAYWTTRTSQSSYRRSRVDYPESVDLYPYFRNSVVQPTPNTVTYQIGANLPLSTWHLDGAMFFNHDGNSSRGVAFFEILDPAGKAIARIYKVAVNLSGTPRLWNISANGAVIVSYSNDLGVVQPNRRPFTVAASASGIVIAWDTYTAITRPVADSGAEYTRPTSVRLRFETSGFGIDRKIDLYKCLFYES